MTNYIEGLIKIKKNKFIFYNEFFSELYKLNNDKKIFCDYIYNFKDNSKFKKNEFNSIFKKVNQLSYKLSKKLNFIHCTNYDQKYWGILIDFYLFFLVKFIYKELKILKLKPDYEKILKKDNKKFVYFNSLSEFHQKFSHDKNSIIFFKTKIFEYFNSKKKKEYFLEKTVNKKKGSNIYNYFFFNILNIYLKTLKPILIIGAYTGKINAIKIFLKSFGKILILPNKFFPEIDKKFTTNKKLRDKLEIKENTNFIKIFNILNKFAFPGTLLENYDFFNKKFYLISKKINNLGFTNGIFDNDTLKFIAAHQKNSKKKIFSLQHGTGYIWKDNPESVFEKKYLDIRFLWTDKNSFGSQYLSKFKFIKNNKKINKDILFLPTVNCLRDSIDASIEKKNHPNKNLNFEIYKNLKIDLKLVSKIKLFPSKESSFTRKIWEKKFGKKLKIISDTASKSITYFKNARVVILDDISTPLSELYYLNIPFVIVLENLDRLKENFKEKILDLKKLDIYFSNPHLAAKFLNKNYNKIEEWWSYNKEQKIFNELRKLLFVDEKLSIESVLKKTLTDKI